MGSDETTTFNFDTCAVAIEVGGGGRWISTISTFTGTAVTTAWKIFAGAIVRALGITGLTAVTNSINLDGVVETYTPLAAAGDSIEGAKGSVVQRL
jgi:hypothetical protein